MYISDFIVYDNYVYMYMYMYMSMINFHCMHFLSKT